MTSLAHILADTEIPGKLIGLLIVAAIYGIGALASWLNKQKKEQEEIARREQIRRAIEAQQAGAMGAAQHQQRQPPPPPRRVTPASTPPTRVTAPPPPLSRRVSKAPRRRVPPPPPIAAPVPPVPVLAPTEGPSSNVLAAMEIGSEERTRRAKTASAGANAIARWLTPATLRQQFILTEILQPPLALRQPEQ
jgi:type II secretory pathway pseudopilin PulG